MLQTYHSNRMESLMDELVHQLESPLSHPMRPETIVIQSPGMGRWLSQQIAVSAGIAANLDFPLPASFVWRIYQWWMPGIPDQAGFDRDSIKWAIMGLLPQCMDMGDFSPLVHYIGEDENGSRIYQLSDRIADLFDQYLVFRPDMLLAWERGESITNNPDERWQASLWRRIVAAANGDHRAALFDRFRSLQTSGKPPVAQLPERVSVFGLSALAPVYLHALQALAKHTQVHLYMLNPCFEYWADIQDEKGLARRRGRWRQTGREDASALMDVGNPLLASMGQVGQVFVDQLLELDVIEHDLFVPTNQKNLLQQVQQDILELRDRRADYRSEATVVDMTDLSIQIHSCHSPLREVQVLHDQLRRLFDRTPQLQPRKVMVMAPDIGVYAPYVQAVFGAADGARYIPWSVSDQGPQEEVPILGALWELLQLPGFRFEASRVISLLEVPAIATRFDMDEQGLEYIRCWLAETAVRWGTDRDMRAAFGLPAESANTWDTGLERLFQGYALPVDAGMQGDILPYADIEGSDAQYLGKLAAFIECLQQWQSRLSTPLYPADWVVAINQLLADFFTPDAEEEPLLQKLRNAIDGMLEHCQINGYAEPISLDIVRAELNGALDAVSSSKHFLLGGVTFCNMVPMRSIPFSVVCLLGMNDQDYPRSEQPLSFDLMADNPKMGDRSRRMDDRYLFLEALLSAREIFYLSYTGRCVKDNSIKAPSVVLSELLDYLAASFKPAQGDKLLDQLLTMHPLQPFNHRYFNASNDRLFSYDAGWLAAADTPDSVQEKAFADAELIMTDPIVDVELEDLIRFMLNPAGWFLLRRLDVMKTEADDTLQDAEPFALDSFTAYQLSTRVLEEMLEGKAADLYMPQEIASGELPHGLVGEIAFSSQADSLAELAERIDKHAGGTPDPLEIDLSIDGFHLTGWLDELTEKGVLSYRPGTLKPKDRVRLWIKHLVLCAVRGSGDLKSVHVAHDKTLLFERVDDPLGKLRDLLQAWQRGQKAPLVFFPAASIEFIEKNNDLDKARKQWEEDYDCGLANWYVQVAFRGSDPLDGEEFMDWAARLAGPLVTAGSIIRARDDL